MSAPVITIPVQRLLSLGLRVTDTTHYQSSPKELVEDALRRKEGRLNDTGALVIQTGEFTGRSPKDRYIVKDPLTEVSVHWNDLNQPIEGKYFDIILKRMVEYFNQLPEIWVRDCYACADPHYRLNIRVISETPAISLFAHNMFLRPTPDELEKFRSDWQILAAPGLRLHPSECGIRQHTAVVISFEHKLILVAGTGYTGEIKKAIFSILNFILPTEHQVLSMHCAANKGVMGDTAVFFGLSGTGKTTLSTDCKRKLIGDDEHGWNANGIFNFEGGCYAKCIHLNRETEPEIFEAIRPGALVENVRFFPGMDQINFDDGSITENTRVSYPISFIDQAAYPSVGGIPKNIFFLTCDAYGILPPVARLTPGQAMYQFISGYTAKVAGTETGITEPKSTFSTCFGAPFMPLHPGRYADMLGEKIKENQVKVWLINTGWTAGAFGHGCRIKLRFTRAIINAALEGNLDQVEYENHPIFQIAMPKSCPNVPSEMLNPRTAWNSGAEYDERARQLAIRFIDNFKKYESGVSSEIIASGPKI
ncbi:MAG: phosphoenolpyruvate carboxykinase (ATP) [Bacteroidetes bacterium]|nr:MAG: phosphoenolpyruvate carboxykinase (ATP) [Bacteroidota bacterium]